MRTNTEFTGEDLLRMPAGKRYELVKGELVKMPPPPGGQHGTVAVNVSFLLKTYSRQTGVGQVAVESGFYTARNPDTVRGPDVAFYAGPEALTAGYSTTPPALAVEIISPRDSWAAVEERVIEYLHAGVLRVWVLHPRKRSLHVYGPGMASRILQEGDSLTGEDVLPGFVCRVRDFF